MRRFPGRDVPSLLWPPWPRQHQLQHRSPQAGNHCPEELLYWRWSDSCQPAGGQNFHHFCFLSSSDPAANRQQSVKTQQPYLDLLLKQPLENKKLKVNPFIAMPSLLFHLLAFFWLPWGSHWGSPQLSQQIFLPSFLSASLSPTSLMGLFSPQACCSPPQ